MKAQTPDIFIFFLEYQQLKDLEGNYKKGEEEGNKVYLFNEGSSIGDVYCNRMSDNQIC